VAGDVFISYSRQDQDYVDRLVTLLRARGASVWIDHQIDYGSRWATVIQTQIRDCSAMLVVMTPSSEASQWVQREINEAEHWAKPIFPLLLEGDRVWFRLSDYQSEEVTAGALPTDGFVAAVMTGGASAAAAPAAELPPSRFVDRQSASSVPTVVVDVMGRGDFGDLAVAVKRVATGTRLLVRPGRYIGGVTVDKALEIIGDGRRSDIVLEASEGPVVFWTATAGRLENLTIRQPGDGSWDGVDAASGAVDIVACDISSLGRVGVAMQASCVTLTRCRIHHCKGSGVFVDENGRGTLEDNDITHNRLSGIAVISGGDPVVRANRITDNTENGVLVDENGRGTFEDNDITNNGMCGLQAMFGGDPVVRANRITDNTQSGVKVSENGRGTVEDNDITHNTSFGIVVESGGDPIVRANRITDNTENGVLVDKNGRGTFEDNDITNNGKSHGEEGVNVASGTPVFRGNRLSDNGRPGIRVVSGSGTYENNGGGEVVSA
jgi:F-box protein 11